MMRAALYVRVSTDEQAKEGFSLDAQERRLRAYIEAQGWSLAGVYRDEGYSGRTVDRPAYQKLMDSESWDVMVVLKMDRAHRNSRNMMDMMDGLKKQGLEFASVTESLDTGSAMGRFVMDIIARIAQLESEVIGERVTSGMTQKAHMGQGSLGGPTPYGYRRGPDGMYPSTLEKDQVKLFFKMATRFRIPAMASLLNAKGFRTRNGKEWSRQSMRRLLTNPVYVGCLRWNGILQCGAHEGIVDLATYNRVQGRIGGQVVVLE